MKKVLLTIIAMFLPLLASAEKVEVGGLNYEVKHEDKTASVTSSVYDGILEIPETIPVGDEDYTVVAIADNAFYYNTNLLSVTLPKTLKSIGNHAFCNCNYLISVKFGDGLESIDYNAFYGCNSLQSVTFGNKVKNIGESAFYGCHSLNQIYISDLKQWCMIDFASELSNPLRYAHRLFVNKKELKDLVIPDGIETIKPFTFYNCESITSLVIGSDVSKIDKYAFYYCKSLANITFPETFSSIGAYSFCGCSIEEIIIPDGITTIEESTFSGCSKLERITFPESLQIIKHSAFSNCRSLKSISIPKSVEFIFQYAFQLNNSVSDDPVEFYLYQEYPPLAYETTFPQNSKIYVPEGSIEPYQNVSPWNNLNLFTYSSAGPDKCAAPVVTYLNGTLSFSSETQDAIFHYTLSGSDNQKNIGNSLDLSGKLKVTVYASKTGYENSETVETEIDLKGIEGDVDGNGVVNVADHVKLTDIIMNQGN